MDTVSLDDEEKQILRIAAYHRRALDLAVARVNPADHEPVRRSLLQPSGATATLGLLQHLPLEIIYEICLYLDIPSLLCFRHVNRRASQIVCGLRPYRVVIQHALDTLCVVLRTKIASFFTISDLQRVVYTKNCLICGSFGGFVFLPSLTRCCFTCLSTSVELLVLTQADLKKFFGTTPTRIAKSVPVLKSLPGQYSTEGRPRKRRLYLLSHTQVALALGLQDSSNPYAFNAAPLVCYMTATTTPYVDKVTGTVEAGVCCTGCQVAIEDDRNPLTDELCERRDKVYSYAGFLEHFAECLYAQDLWRRSEGGTRPVELPVAAKDEVPITF